ncbi:protein of unknown function [Methylocaldum szegediense]|uniref:Uncharacterized protein n=1 Tax=Methylocaldum szegediense TaxID=73780 RepID=A0ABM9I9R6_9GAMM|nr:protein of unknown function [Methylocaldum szegediense]
MDCRNHGILLGYDNGARFNALPLALLSVRKSRQGKRLAGLKPYCMRLFPCFFGSYW